MSGEPAAHSTPLVFSGHHSKKLKPDKEYRSIAAINPRELYESGIRLVSFDFDQTLSRYEGREISETIKPVLKEFLSVFPNKVCVISNRNEEERIKSALKDWPIRIMASKKHKPDSEMFKKAEQFFNEKSERAVHIGDRLLTDVLGAHLALWKAIKVSPLEPPSDPFNIKLTRLFENLLAKFI